MSEATWKQKALALSIFYATGADLPETCTKQTLGQYIDENIEEYKDVLKQEEDE